MPGMLSPAEVEGSRELQAPDFDARFVELMTVHHKGAIAMADEALARASDPRLKLMAQGIRHAQAGEIELMHASEGLSAVNAAVAALLGGRGPALAASGPMPWRCPHH
jgi:hypothetical protein